LEHRRAANPLIYLSSFGDDLKEVENFLLKVEHDKKAHVFIDPTSSKACTRSRAPRWAASPRR
jgi:hypothetical protein